MRQELLPNCIGCMRLDTGLAAESEELAKQQIPMMKEKAGVKVSGDADL